MLLESDIIIAHMKREDWLKKKATEIFEAIQDGRLKEIQLSSEVFHELYYVFSDYAPLSLILTNEAWLATVKNITFIDPTKEIYLSALDLMETYHMKSIFDAIYASTALSEKTPDHIIVSTDDVYGRIKGIQRIDPRELQI
mgnify:CR=1 FL=1